MITYAQWIAKFPQFITLPEPIFEEFVAEATLEMGRDVNRWTGEESYNIALGYLVGHLAALDEAWRAGSHNPLQPLRTKEVDGVMVEFAVSRDMQNNLDPYLSTVYGQQYLKWRRMVFAGPRVVGSGQATVASVTYPPAY